MSSSGNELDVRRVLVTIDLTRPIAGAIEAAAGLAASLGVELACLYVEELDLIRSAGLPFAYEVGAFSSQARRLDPDDVVRMWRRDAEQVRHALAAAAEQWGLRWSFQIERGGLIGCILDLRRGGDLVLLAEAGGIFRRPSSPGASPGFRTRPILAAPFSTEAEERSIVFARRFAAAEGQEATEEPEPAEGSLGRATREQPAPAQSTGTPRRIRRLAPRASPSAQALRSAIRQIRPDVVVLPAAAAQAMKEELAALLRLADCAFVIHP